MNLETVRLEVADYIATVTMDRPPVNAQNQKAREELIRVFDAISDRDDVRVAILTAAGKVFSAGADVKERVGLAKEPGDYIRNNRLVREYFYAISDCTKPVICAVERRRVRRRLRADARLRHHDRQRGRVFRHPRARRRPRRRRALPDGSFREVDGALLSISPGGAFRRRSFIGSA